MPKQVVYIITLCFNELTEIIETHSNGCVCVIHLAWQRHATEIIGCDLKVLKMTILGVQRIFSRLHILVVVCFGLDSRSVSGIDGEAAKKKREIENTMRVSWKIWLAYYFP